MILLRLPLNLKIAVLFLWDTLYRPSYLCFSTHWDLDEKPSPVGWAYLLGSCPIARTATTRLIVHFSSIPRMTTCQRLGRSCRNVCSVWSHHDDKLFVPKCFSPSPQKSPGLDWAFPPDQPKASGFVNPSFYKLDNRKPYHQPLTWTKEKEMGRDFTISFSCCLSWWWDIAWCCYW